MTTSKTFRFSALAFAVATLAACGGGGGSDVGTPATAQVPAPSSTALAPVVSTRQAQSVRLTGLNISAKDILVETAPSVTSVAALFLRDIGSKALNVLVPNAFAALNDDVKPGVNFGFTNKIQDGKLISIGVHLKTKDGKETACLTGTAEAKVFEVWKIKANQNFLIAKLSYPTVIEADCSVLSSSYQTSTFAVVNGNTLDLSVPGEQIVRIIEAGDQAFNTSENALVVYDSGMIRELAVDANGVSTLTDLSASTLPVRTNYDGAFAYNGVHLVGLPKGRTDAALIYEKSSKTIKMIVVNANGTDGTLADSRYPAQGVMIDNTGKFIWMDDGVAKRELDLSTGTYKKWAPVAEAQYIGSAPMGTSSAKQIPFTYGIRGRIGTTMLDDRGILWNWATGDAKRLTNPENMTVVSFVGGSTYSRLTGDGIALTVNEIGNIYTRYNVNTNELRYFNTDTTGYYFSRSRAAQVFKDRVMLLDAVSLVSSDVRIVEMNFDTNQVIDRGVVIVGDRKVVKLVTAGN